MIPDSDEIRIEVTTRCNYKCIICPREKLTRPLETMSIDLFTMIFDKILAETDQYRILTFPGLGEPLLDPTINEKICYAKERGFRVLMLTNGYLLTPECFKQLEESGIDSIRVSMYGATAATYIRVHGLNEPSYFKKVKENVTTIAAMKKKAELLLTYNVVPGINDHEIDQWIAEWKEKADLLEVWRPHNWVNGRHYRKVQTQKVKTCGRPFKTPLQVQVDGTVNMCCFDFDGKLTLGDLKRQSLSEIFSSSVYKAIVKCHESGDYAGSGLICENCDQRNKDKADVMIYNSKFDIKTRVGQVSTTYKKIV